MSAPSSSTVGLPSIADLHLLLVDDDALFLGILQAMLGKLGVTQITRAVNGSDAFEKLRHAKKVVDCILCDYSMEAGNGLQLLQAVRTKQIHVIRPDTCFVLVTSSRDQDVIATAGQLDVNGYLVKPVTPESLHAAVVKARGRPVRLDMQKYAAVQIPAT
jgi:CheY-like chemotaxis protein